MNLYRVCYLADVLGAGQHAKLVPAADPLSAVEYVPATITREQAVLEAYGHSRILTVRVPGAKRAFAAVMRVNGSSERFPWER